MARQLDKRAIPIAAGGRLRPLSGKDRHRGRWVAAAYDSNVQVVVPKEIQGSSQGLDDPAFVISKRSAAQARQRWFVNYWEEGRDA